MAAEQYVPVHCPSFRPSSQSFTWLFLPVRGHNERFLARTPLFPHRDAPRFVPMPGPSAHLHGQVSGNLFPPRYSLLPSSSSPLTYHHCIFVVESDFFWRCLTVFDGVWRCLMVFDDVWRRFDRRFRGNWRPMIQIYFFLRYYKCCDWFGLIGDGLKESDLFGIYTFRLVSLLSYIMVRSYSLLYRNMLFLVWFDSIWRKFVVSLGFIRIYFLYHQRVDGLIWFDQRYD